MNHFGLITNDIDGTIDLYREVLGFQPIAHSRRELGGRHVRLERVESELWKRLKESAAAAR